MAEKIVERLTVTNFGAVGDGHTDDYPAFVAAIASVPAEAVVEIDVPRPPHAYYISKTVGEAGRHVSFMLAAGVEFTGPAKPPYYVGRSEQRNGSERTVFSQGSGRGDHVIGDNLYIVNNGSEAAYGARMQYDSFVGVPASANGGDIADAHFSIWHNADKAGLLGKWHVAVSPETGPGSSQSWGMSCMEVNPVNRGPDRGWSNRPGQQTFVGGINVVADLGEFAGGKGTNVLYAYGAGSNGGPRCHNLFLGSPDAIAPGGRGVYLNGAAKPEHAPEAAFEVGQGEWRNAIRTDTANLATGRAVQIGASQHIAWVDGDQRTLSGFFNGPGDPNGVVIAPVGSLYTSRAGGVGRTLYVKEQGSGATGWVAK